MSQSDYYGEVCRIARELSGCKGCTADWHYAMRDYAKGCSPEESARKFVKAWGFGKK